ncbi:hypothetical protein B0H19DRAFT_1055493 [Mycena capillaripes]|nr:hypothetical protein B0H19DRAFT_1055493 [Mycena capillaripes]
MPPNHEAELWLRKSPKTRLKGKLSGFNKVTVQLYSAMLNALWQFFSPWARPTDPPPLQRPQKYSRSTDFLPDSSQERHQELYENQPQEAPLQREYFAQQAQLVQYQNYAAPFQNQPWHYHRDTGFSPFPVVPQPTPVAAPHISAPGTDQSLVKSKPIHHDHSASSAQDWPTGLVRIECVKARRIANGSKVL